MNFTSGRARKRLKAVEITPMIDVVFLLIIFFMTTARFAQDTKADLDLPLERGAQEEESAEAGLVINLARDGSVIIDDKVVDHDGIINRVQAEVAQSRGRSAAGVAITIRADRGAPAESLNELVTILQELGLGGARIATEVP